MLLQAILTFKTSYWSRPIKISYTTKSNSLKENAKLAIFLAIFHYIQKNGK